MTKEEEDVAKTARMLTQYASEGVMYSSPSEPSVELPIVYEASLLCGRRGRSSKIYM